MKIRLNIAAGREGFTFNEILVAISIIVVAILGYSLNTIGVIRGNSASGHLTAAVNLAQDKMEELKADAALKNVAWCPDGGDRNIMATGEQGGIYQRCWTVTDSPLGANLKRVDVTVSWRDYEDRQITISTLIFTG